MTLLSRAEFLRLTAGAFVAQTLTAAQESPAERVARLIQQYDAQGVHRTATDVDNESARWLALAASAAGAEVQLDAFDLERIDVRSAYLEADGRRIDGTPFFDGTFTRPEGIAGRLN